MASRDTFLFGEMPATCRPMRILGCKPSATLSAIAIQRRCRNTSIAGIFWPCWRFDFKKKRRPAREAAKDLPGVCEIGVAQLKAPETSAQFVVEAEPQIWRRPREHSAEVVPPEW